MDDSSEDNHDQLSESTTSVQRPDRKRKRSASFGTVNERDLNLTELDATDQETNQQSFPPAERPLSDYDLFRVLTSELSLSDKISRYHLDFSTEGFPMKTRIGRGRPVVVTCDKSEFYLVCCGIQLHGQEGSNQGIATYKGPETIVPNLHPGDRRESSGKSWIVHLSDEQRTLEPTKEHDDITSRTSTDEPKRDVEPLIVLSDEEEDPEDGNLLHYTVTIERSLRSSMKIIEELMASIKKDGDMKGRRIELKMELRKIQNSVDEGRRKLPVDEWKSIEDSI